jgi:magnesium transporter
MDQSEPKTPRPPEPSPPSGSRPAEEAAAAALEQLVARLRASGASDGARLLATHADGIAAAAVERMSPPQALALLDELDEPRREAVRAAASPAKREQWTLNARYGEDTLGRLMELPAAVHTADTTVAQAVEHLREAVKTRFITYLYVVDRAGRLLGLVVMREMLLAHADDRLGDFMLKDPFAFRPETLVADAMKEAAAKQFPVYPVCDGDGRLLGLVRGQDLFEQNLFSIVVQAGSMVGVEKEERVTTTWQRSLRMRHPWLELNLLTAVVAGVVVGMFEETINRVVVLAAFLPILAGQSGNTGCQALAVTLRGMTLGDLAQLRPAAIVAKEALVGALNGAIIGLIAGVLMFVYARASAPETNAPLLGLVVWLAMTGSCIASGVSGTLVPITLRKMGADPATASSIFLTTATDVVSMGLLLGLASWLVL